MQTVDFTGTTEVAIFPSDNEVIQLPAGVELSGSTTVKIAGSDFIMEFANGKKLVLLFGGIFTSLGNNLTIKDARGNSIDVSELISTYEVQVKNDVILQPIDAMSLNQLLEKIPEDQEGQEIASGNAEEGDDGKATGKEGKAKDKQEEKDFTITTDTKTDDKPVKEVTGSGSTEAGGEDDLQEAAEESKKEQEKTEDFTSEMNNFTSSSKAKKSEEFTQVAAQAAKPETAGSISDSEALIQTTLELDVGSDSGSSNVDRITNAITLKLKGVSTDGATVGIWLVADFDTTALIQPKDPLVRITVPTGATANEWVADIAATNISKDGIYDFIALPIGANGINGIISAPLSITIDRTIEKPTIMLSTTSASTLDSTFTNDSTFDLNGKGEAGSIITLSIGGTPVTSVTPIRVNSIGEWSYTLTAPLPDGSHQIIATATDTAGNSSLTDTYTVTVDTVAPVVPNITGIVHDNVGGVSGSGFVGDSTPVVNGTSVTDAYIVVSIDGVEQTAFKVTNTDGSWSYKVPYSLSEGSHTFIAIASDAAGNRSTASGSSTVIVANPSNQLNIQLAEVSDTGIKGDLVTSSMAGLKLEGTGAAGEQLVIRSGKGAGATDLGIVTVDASSQWNLTLSSPLTEGRHTLSVNRTATSQTKSIELNIDATINAPTFTLSTDTVGALSNGLYYVSGTAGQLQIYAKTFSTIQIDVGGSTIPSSFVADANGRVNVNIVDLGLNTAPNANNQLSITATDVAGNSAKQTATVISNPPGALVPTVGLSVSDQTGGSSNSAFTSHKTSTVEGITTANSVVAVYIVGQTNTLIARVQSNGDGRYVAPTSLAPLSDGKYTIRVETTNLAGQAAGQNFTFEVDTVAPTTPTLDLNVNDDTGQHSTDNITNGGTDRSLRIDGSGSRNGDVVTVFINNTKVVGVPTIVADASGNWNVSLDFVARTSGIYNVTAMATDRAGNVSTLSSPLSINFDIDITASTVALQTKTGFSDTSTNDTTPGLAGITQTGNTISVEITPTGGGGTLTFGSTTDSAGAWSITSSNLSAGSYNAIVTTTDIAGNSIASPVFTFTVDTIAPLAPVLSSISIISPGLDSKRVTTDQTPEFRGGGLIAGNQVEIIREVSGVDVAYTTRVTVDSLGNWSFVVPNPLAQGTHSFKFRQIDPAGNVSPDTDFAPFSIQPADVSGSLSINLVTTSDSGTIGDFVTNLANVNLQGTGRANESLNLYQGDTLLGTVLTTVTGSWTYNSVTLTSGTQNLSIVRGSGLPSSGTISTDNISQRSFELDNVVSSLNLSFTGTSGTDSGGTASHYINALTGKLVVTTEALAIVNVLVGTAIVFTGTANSQGQYEVDLSDTKISSRILPGGSGNSININVQDRAGNTSTISRQLFYDTTAPLSPSVALSVLDQTGGASNPTFTNKDNFTISGTTEGNASVSLTFAIMNLTNTVIKTAPVIITTANAAGVFNANIPVVLVPVTTTGNTVIVRVDAVATDLAGNTSTAQTDITVDRHVPVAPTLDLEATSDSGSNTSDNITRTTSIIIGGNAGSNEAGGTIRLLQDSVAVGAPITIGADGTWTSTITGLAGSRTGIVYNFTATHTDKAGNVSTVSAPLRVTIDSGIEQPIISVMDTTDRFSFVTDTVTNDTPYTLGGTAEANSLVSLSISYAGLTSPINVNITADGQGLWTYAAPANIQGSRNYEVTLTGSDIAGNSVALGAPFRYVVDTVAPTAVSSFVVATSGAGFTNGNLPVITGTGTAGDYIQVYIDNVAITPFIAPSNGNWSYTPVTPLSEGIHTFSARTIDTAGNTSAKVVDVVLQVDTQAPTTTLLFSTNSSNALTTNSNSVAVSGTITGRIGEVNATNRYAVTVSVNGTDVGTVNADPLTGNWNFNINTSALIDGTHPVSVIVRDPAANVSASVTATLTRDTIYTPNVSVEFQSTALTSITNSITNTSDTTAEFQGVAEKGTTVSLVISGTGANLSVGSITLASVTADANGRWTASNSTAVAPGTYQVVANSTDPGGNISTATFDFVVDNAAPVTTSFLVTGSTTSVIRFADTTPEFSGTAEANSIVLVRLGTVTGNIVGSFQVAGDGSWKGSVGSHIAGFTAGAVFGPISQSSNTLVFQSVDAAGNAAATTISQQIDIQTQAPQGSPGTLFLTPGDVSATIGGQDSTKSTILTLTGQTVVPSQLTANSYRLFIGIDNLAPIDITSRVQGAGNWTFELNAANLGVANVAGVIADGAHQTRVYLQNQFGAQSSTPTTYTYNVDTTAPASGTIAYDTSASLFQIANGITNDTIRLAGKASEANLSMTVSYTTDGTNYTDYVFSPTTDASGNWSLVLAGLPDSSGYQFRVKATDQTGNSGANSNLTTTVTLDTVASANITSSLVLNDNTPTFSGTAETGANIGITDLDLRILNSSDVQVFAQDNINVGSGAWTSNQSTILTDGTYTARLIATDGIGNVTTTNTSFTIDTVVPNAATITNVGSNTYSSVSSNYSVGTSAQITGTGVAGDTVVLRYNTSTNASTQDTAVVDANGAWSLNPLVPTTLGAAQTVFILAMDAAGNLSSSTQLILTSTGAAISNFFSNSVLFESAEYVNAKGAQAETLSSVSVVEEPFIPAELPPPADSFDNVI